LDKGKQCTVVGPVSVSSYEAKDGTGTRFSLDVRAEDVEFLSPKSEELDAAEPHSAPASKPLSASNVDDEDLPF